MATLQELKQAKNAAISLAGSDPTDENIAARDAAIAAYAAAESAEKNKVGAAVEALATEDDMKQKAETAPADKSKPEPKPETMPAKKDESKGQMPAANAALIGETKEQTMTDAQKAAIERTRAAVEKSKQKQKDKND